MTTIRIDKDALPQSVSHAYATAHTILSAFTQSAPDFLPAGVAQSIIDESRELVDARVASPGWLYVTDIVDLILNRLTPYWVAYATEVGWGVEAERATVQGSDGAFYLEYTLALVRPEGVGEAPPVSGVSDPVFPEMNPDENPFPEPEGFEADVTDPIDPIEPETPPESSSPPSDEPSRDNTAPITPPLRVGPISPPRLTPDEPESDPEGDEPESDEEPETDEPESGDNGESERVEIIIDEQTRSNRDAINVIVETTVNVSNDVIVHLDSFAEGLISTLDSIRDGIIDGLNNAPQLAIDAIDRVRDDATQLFERVIDGFLSTLDFFQEDAETRFNMLVSLIEDLTGERNDAGLRNIAEAILTIPETLEGVVTKPLTAMAETLETARQAIETLWLVDLNVDQDVMVSWLCQFMEFVQKVREQCTPK